MGYVSLDISSDKCNNKNNNNNNDYVPAGPDVLSFLSANMHRLIIKNSSTRCHKNLYQWEIYRRYPTGTQRKNPS